MFPFILGLLLGALLGAGLAVLALRRRTATSQEPSTGSPERMAGAGRRLAEVAHELNNPLGAILAFAQDLLRADPSPEQRESLLVIQRQARRSRKLVRGLLEEVQAVQPGGPRVDPGELVRAVAPVFEREAERHGLGFEVHVDASLPALEGDADGLEQVLTNLLRNAFQATPRGGRVTLHGRARGRLLEFVVQDNGPGIPPEHLSRIFEPFYTTKAPGEGTGLGLSVSQTIVRRHRGTLVAENLPPWEGGGARFVVALPFVDRRVRERDQPDDEPEVEGAGGRVGRRALVIEDDADVRLAVRRYLERYGWQVTEASDGPTGLLRAEGEAWDLVLCDVQLPGLSGMELYDRLRGADPARTAHFIMVTGDAGRTEVASFRNRTGVPMLEKPFELELFGHAVQQAARP